MISKKRLPILGLLLFAVACSAWLLSLDTSARFTTDVTELLPADERDPEARLALSLVHERQSRIVLVVLETPAGTAPAALSAAAEAHAASLRASPAFAAAHPLADLATQRQLGRLLFDRRFDLLLPAWLADQRRAYSRSFHPSEINPPPPFPAWLAARATAALDAHLASPAASATADLLASDPLLLLPALADRAADLVPANTTPPGRALVWAETRDGPLSEAGQQPVFAALASAEDAARLHVPALSARFSAVARFASAAKASTRAEIARLNLLALVAVLALTALCVRRVFGLLHLIPVVLLSTLGAVAATTLVFPRVHVLVFVLGSLLSGVAVDYAFHLVLARRENEPYPARVRRLALPLLGGAGTTLAGFLVLSASELPLVRQLGVYVAAGIATGLGVTLLYFSLFPDLDLAPRRLPLRPFNLNVPLQLTRRRLRASALAALAAFAAFGLSRIRWQDDLRALEYPSPALRAEDASLRSAFGATTPSATFLTRGANFTQARERWQKFADSAPGHSPVAGLATLLPLPADYAAATAPAALAELAGFAAAFATATASDGFEPDALAPFQREFAAYLATPPPDYETLLRDTLDSVPGPLGLLARHDADGVWFLSTAARPFPVPAAAEGTTSLAGIEGLNHLFARYRVATARLSFAGILVLVVLSCCLHGPRLGLRIAALPLLATALAFALLALRSEPFGLFHLLGALLGVCLADDYAHFAHADDGGAGARASIRLSALTTASSFATLTLSAIPAISSLGAAVALIVVFALLFVETDLFSLRRHA